MNAVTGVHAVVNAVVNAALYFLHLGNFVGIYCVKVWNGCSDFVGIYRLHAGVYLFSASKSSSTVRPLSATFGDAGLSGPPVLGGSHRTCPNTQTSNRNLATSRNLTTAHPANFAKSAWK
jgi:hypothetical protein